MQLSDLEQILVQIPETNFEFFIKIIFRFSFARLVYSNNHFAIALIHGIKRQYLSPDLSKQPGAQLSIQVSPNAQEIQNTYQAFHKLEKTVRVEW